MYSLDSNLTTPNFVAPALVVYSPSKPNLNTPELDPGASHQSPIRSRPGQELLLSLWVDFPTEKGRCGHTFYIDGILVLPC